MLLIPAPLPFNPTYISDMFEVQRIVDDTESVVISEDRETEIRITKKEANSMINFFTNNNKVN